ncbi:MAG: hypothetical protein OSA97_11085 [Nevskia sp.]|nr:hypothetical protein [Nevskia sp.]
MKRLLLAAAIGAALTATSAYARDDRLKFSIDGALNTPDAKQKVDNSVQLFWGTQKHPAPLKDLGTFTANKKTNGFAKSDQSACERAFLSAVISLQERARSEGGNAVVDIVSYYKKDEVSSETEFECGAGGFVSGVALRGTIVKLP